MVVLVTQVSPTEVTLMTSRYRGEAIRGGGRRQGQDRNRRRQPGPKKAFHTSLTLSCFAILNHDENSEFGFGLESPNPWDEKLAGTLRQTCCSPGTFLHFKRYAVSFA